ncbi:MAG: CapA family protein [bacterium]|nr:CapA family protein [bacterium]
MSKRLLIILIIFVAASGTVFLARKFDRPVSSPPLPTREFVDQMVGDHKLQVKGPKDVEIILTGDIMLSRNVAMAIKKAGNPDLPFLKLADFLNSSDFNFGNLESPFSGRNNITPSGSMVFNAPTNNIKGLVDNNFKILSLANNHALDQGIKGLNFTREHLAESGIASVGAGNNQDEAWQGEVVEVRGIKIGFLAASYASQNDGGKGKNAYVARTDDFETLKSKVLNLKSQADIVIVSMHAGTEYALQPNTAQTDFAHAAIDAGADVVVGHHPHWVQGYEKYGNGIIFYSLGNFIFDQEWSQKTKEGLAVKIKISDSKLQSAELFPIIIENYCCARLMTEKEKTGFMKDYDLATSTIWLLP